MSSVVGGHHRPGMRFGPRIPVEGTVGPGDVQVGPMFKIVRFRMIANTLTGDTSLTLTDEEGKPRSVLALLNGAAGLVLLDTGRKARIGLQVAATGTPDVSVADANGKRRVVLSVVPNGNPLIGVLDENEQPRAALGRNASGDGLVLFGPNVKPAVTIAIYPTGTATGNALTFWDQNAKPRLSLGTFTSADVPGIVASDGDAKVIWKVP